MLGPFMGIMLRMLRCHFFFAITLTHINTSIRDTSFHQLHNLAPLFRSFDQPPADPWIIYSILRIFQIQRTCLFSCSNVNDYNLFIIIINYAFSFVMCEINCIRNSVTKLCVLLMCILIIYIGHTASAIT